MKNFKRILVILLALTLALSLFACGKNENPTPGGTATTCKHPDDDKDMDCKCDICKKNIKHKDGDGDGLCDRCEKDLGGGKVEDEDGIVLIEDEEILFQVVLGSDTTSAIKMTVDAVADILEEYGAELKIVTDKADNETELEILIGTVTSRGEDYEYDKYSLGAEGYIISAIDETKILIAAGSDEVLDETVKTFFHEYLGITEDMDELANFAFGESHEALEIQDDYRIDSISIGDVDLGGYTISRDRGDGVTDAIAKRLQKFFYEKAGYYLDIVNPADAGEKTISFRLVDKGEAGPTGFRTRLDGETLIIECAHKGKYEEAFNEFYASFSTKQGDVTIEEFDGDTDFTTIYYSDFGVKGDGKTDDSAAIRAAHDEANKNNQTVLGEKGATYYIGKVETPIIIKTDVDWRGAKFIFDASDFQPGDSGNVFKIDNDNLPHNFYTKEDPVLKAINENVVDGLVIKGINHGDEQTTKLDVGIHRPLMLKVYNSDARAYIRWGYVDTMGGQQCEVVIVDENGNIDPTTPFLLDYEKVTSIVAYPIDIAPITIKNATVESRNSLVNLLGAYKSIAHSFELARPNVTMENLKHVITQEFVYETPTRQNPATGLWEDVSSEGYTVNKSTGIVYKNGQQYKGTDVKPFTGYSYSGFIQVSNTHNSLIKDCVFQARYHYEEGTYDISCSYANQIEFRNCTQSNFFEKDENGNETTVANIGTYWGIAGTNYCKNMYYVDSVLTRYDAHCGVYNGGVKGGKIAVIRLIGGGTFTIEGVDFHARGVPVQLREDYGATFNGTVIIKDTHFNHIWGGTNYALTLFDAPTANVYNGYGTYFPNIVIDNISVGTSQTEINLIGVCNQKYSASGDHFPSRCPIRDNAHDPDALFTYFYETANPNIVEEDPDKFPFLAGRTKNTTATSYTQLKDTEYMVYDNQNGTYTVIAQNVKNLQPYHTPDFIEIKNMENAKNINGQKMIITIYESNFFDNTEITYEEGTVKFIAPPKR